MLSDMGIKVVESEEPTGSRKQPRLRFTVGASLLAAGAGGPEQCEACLLTTSPLLAPG